MSTASEASDRKIVLVRDTGAEPATFEARALRAIDAIGGRDAEITRRFEADGVAHLTIVFARDDDGAVPDVADRIAPLGVAFEKDSAASSQ